MSLYFVLSVVENNKNKKSVKFQRIFSNTRGSEKGTRISGSKYQTYIREPQMKVERSESFPSGIQGAKS